MTLEQRDRFDREIADKVIDQSGASTTGAETAQRRAYALAQGEIG